MKTVFSGAHVYNTASKEFIDADIYVNGGTVISVGERPYGFDDANVVDISGKYVLPGLVDVHTHGRAGFDFNSCDTHGIDVMRSSYAKAGTTTIFATLASDALDRLEKSIDNINSRRQLTPGLTTIAGTHLEGRYFNVKKKGAHAVEYLAPLDPDEVESLIRKMYPLPARVSLAPELSDNDDFIKRVVSLGAVASIAHSDATYAQARSAVESGATGFTHTFNAMRAIHHREPGNAIASLLSDEAYTEIICDGEHINPAMVELTRRCKPDGKLVLITDSMEATGMPDGVYGIGGLKVIVTNGMALTEEGVLAGSTLNLFKAVVNFMKFTGSTLEETIPCATINPASFAHIDGDCGSIEGGKRADFIVIADKEKPEIEQVYTLGVKVER